MPFSWEAAHTETSQRNSGQKEKGPGRATVFPGLQIPRIINKVCINHRKKKKEKSVIELRPASLGGAAAGLSQECSPGRKF